MGRTWRKNSEFNKKNHRDEQKLLRKKREKLQKRLKTDDDTIYDPRWVADQKKEQ